MCADADADMRTQAWQDARENDRARADDEVSQGSLLLLLLLLPRPIRAERCTMQKEMLAAIAAATARLRRRISV